MGIRSFQIISIILLFQESFQNKAAEKFACTEDEAACKTKFGTEYEKTFKELHLSFGEAAINRYIKLVKPVLGKKGKKPPMFELLSETANHLEGDIKTLKENKDDPTKVNDVLIHVQSELINALTNKTTQRHFAKVPNDAKIKSIRFKFETDAAKSYEDMFAGLRDQDLTANPNYGEINKLMQMVLKTKEEEKLMFFQKAIEELGRFFDLAYVKAFKPVL